MSVTEELDPRALETAFRFVARIFAEELVRAFRAADSGAAVPATAPSTEPAGATSATAPTAAEPKQRRFGLRPPDAIAEDEPFGPVLRFLEDDAKAVGALFGGSVTAAPRAVPEPDPTIGDVFALGPPRRRGGPEPELEVFP